MQYPVKTASVYNQMRVILQIYYIISSYRYQCAVKHTAHTFGETIKWISLNILLFLPETVIRSFFCVLLITRQGSRSLRCRRVFFSKFNKGLMIWPSSLATKREVRPLKKTSFSKNPLNTYNFHLPSLSLLRGGLVGSPL